jgi:hypothetical protein
MLPILLPAWHGNIGAMTMAARAPRVRRPPAPGGRGGLVRDGERLRRRGAHVLGGRHRRRLVHAQRRGLRHRQQRRQQHAWPRGGGPTNPPPCSSTTLDAHRARSGARTRQGRRRRRQHASPRACRPARRRQPPLLSHPGPESPASAFTSRSSQQGSELRPPASGNGRWQGAARPAARPGCQAHPCATGRACPTGAAGGRARRARPRQRRRSAPQRAPDPGAARGLRQTPRTAPLSLATMDVTACASVNPGDAGSSQHSASRHCLVPAHVLLLLSSP